MSIKSIIRKCSQLVESSELKDSLLPLWKSISWENHSGAQNIDPVNLDCAGDTTIHLYANLEQDQRAVQKVLREFGNLVLIRSGERGAAIWKGKLDIPTELQVSTVKDKLSDPILRQTCKKYADVLDNYPSKGGSVDRLVYINIVNALLANNIAYADSVGVDIYSWGPTQAYANREKYHCLVPLVSAYAPYEVFNCYGSALSDMVEFKLQSVRDSSVAYALRGIVQRIAKATA